MYTGVSDSRSSTTSSGESFETSSSVRGPEAETKPTITSAAESEHSAASAAGSGGAAVSVAMSEQASTLAAGLERVATSVVGVDRVATSAAVSEQATPADGSGHVLTLADGSEEAPTSADGPERTMSAAESEQATSAAGSDPSAAGSECAALSEKAVMSPADSGQAGMRAAGRTQGLVELALGGPVDRDLLDSLVRDPPRDIWWRINTVWIHGREDHMLVLEGR
jgi:hypothetical protein